MLQLRIGAYFQGIVTFRPNICQVDCIPNNSQFDAKQAAWTTPGRLKREEFYLAVRVRHCQQGEQHLLSDYFSSPYLPTKGDGDFSVLMAPLTPGRYELDNPTFAANMFEVSDHITSVLTEDRLPYPLLCLVTNVRAGTFAVHLFQGMADGHMVSRSAQFLVAPSMHGSLN